jgi:hypothetical protein
MIHTFESLKDLPSEELAKIKQATANELAAARQKRWDMIAAILFYQDQIKRETP